MNEYFVTFEIAKKLKEKGFKEKCYAYYSLVNNELFYNINQFRGGSLYDCLYSYNSLTKGLVASNSIDAPTIPQVLKLLREKKDISVEPCATPYNCWYYMIKCKGEIKVTYTNNKYKTYELAALAGIEYVLDNLI